MAVLQDARGDEVDTANTAGWGAAQSRLVTWRDPITTQTTVASMPGLVLEGRRRRKVAPAANRRVTAVARR